MSVVVVAVVVVVVVLVVIILSGRGQINNREHNTQCPTLW